MTVGRLVGDAVNHRIGPVALLRGGALLTGVPLAAMLLIGTARRRRWSGCSSSASAWPTACR